MGINYAGLVVLVIGALFLVMAVVQPDICLYRSLKSKSSLCVGEEASARFVMAYSLLMVIFGTLLTFRVFGKQES